MKPESPMHKLHHIPAYLFLASILYWGPALYAQSMSTASDLSPNETNKAVVRFFIEEVWNRGRLELCDIMIGPPAIGHFRGRDIPFTPAYTKDVVNRWRTCLAGFRFTIESLFAEGELVAAHVPFEGTHVATILGIPATGRKVAVDEILICKVHDHKIVEFWEVYDEYEMRKQLTAPATPPASSPPIKADTQGR
jgi:predicted ester cyclase